ncbi:MAG: glycosyltransferase [Candidatus Moraniibacteriota bacterium]|nr:MAG: glycosyltransferase [Candidatus Moranbacteria bacterium]
MKIAFVTNKYYPNPRGSSGGLESLRFELMKQGHVVFVLASHRGKSLGREEGVFRYRVTEIFGKRLVWNSHQIIQDLDSLNVDIVHTQQYDGLGKIAREWAKKRGVPWIQTVSDTISVEKSRLVKELPNTTIVPTEIIGEMLRKATSLNQKIVVLPTGVVPEFFLDPNGSAVRKKWDIPSDAKVLLSVSRVTQEKNSQFLFQSLTSLIKRRENVYLLCVGGGNLVDFFRTEVVARGLGNRVFFAEEVPKYDMKHYYACADVFVYVSKEDFRAVVVEEAMYAGLPVVAVSSGGAQERIIDQVTGFLASDAKESSEFSDAVEHLLDNEEKAKSFGKAGHLYAEEHYKSSLCAKSLVEVYEKSCLYRG